MPPAETGENEVRVVLAEIRDAGDGEDATVGDVVDSLAHSGFGALILLPALLGALPTGAIPGIGIVTGLMIVLFAGQMLLGFDRPWLPKSLRRRKIGGERFRKSMNVADRWTQKTGPLLKHRVAFMTGRVAAGFCAFVFLAIGLSMLPLAIIPGGQGAAALAAAVISIGLLARDGVWVIVGLAGSVGAFYLAATLQIMPW